MFIPASSMEYEEIYCTVPPQPANGYRHLRTVQCPLQQSNCCNLQEGAKLPILSHLIYTCNSGYQLNSSGDVFCDEEGNWSNIPICTEIRCEPLTSASTNADCTLNGQWVSCKSPVLPGTTAKLSCRDNYQEIGNSQSKQVDQVICNNKGQWEPQPMQCLPNTLSYNRNILVKNGTVKVQINIERNNPLCHLLKVLPDKIIIETDACDWNYSYIDIR
ncbi:sushi, von Willebrand factor type A, EGF and pentraxin domain-containing protein 1-like [Polistes fuscatus]|uniref:sushi, von Willebrand factor type A, EGF and pentraxin domain-containing protein 1-like n=1 Tax=Polistes fuscatus TaxID=30207 RepID=UPI001CA7C88F|nr:sushi, von Willebrand factor type A, EGF and pentraxin domain-containing protein 1-like [Polistes fuscatus]